MVKDVLKTVLNSNMRLSEHFSLYEFFHSRVATLHGIDNIPPTYKKLTEVLVNLRKLVEILEIIRAANGDTLILINSGYRCPKLNRLVNGAFRSTHMDGLAADITCSDLRHLVETIESLELPIYWYVDYDKNYIHINLKL